ncbi:MAG: 30S ribosomal protein S2 [Candidatus Dojkabacteria bacterium]|nr:30S ribosomal protein S2 [Candidatus Dojkabacteria bacterium]
MIFVGTKKQSARIVEEEAIRSGSYFVSARWAGGLLTNFSEIKKSLRKLTSIEKSFEEGVQGRTKYEISRMKKRMAKTRQIISRSKIYE